jgi:hypothetical protein
MGSSLVNIATGIAISRYAISQKLRGFVWATEELASGQVACHFGVSWKVKFQKNCIWIRDIANSEVSME